MMTIKSPRERELRGHGNGRLELPMRGNRTTLLDRFMGKVDVPVDPDGCWMWTGAQAGPERSRYGRIWTGRRTAAGNPSAEPAHRIAYELFVGPVDEGLEIDHLCRTPLCVNPFHLEPVTRLVNQRRGRSPIQAQRLRTRCPQGHPLDETNTYTWNGMRRCRECNRVKAAEYRARKSK